MPDRPPASATAASTSASSATPAARRSRSASARATDPAFPRYPRLPVLECPGHEPRRPADAGAGTLRPPRRQAGARAQRARRSRATTRPIATTSSAAEVLAEDDESDQRGDRRLQAHQHAERRPWQAPQRLELERVGDRRAQHRDREADRQQPRRQQVEPPCGDARRQDQRSRSTRPSPGPGPRPPGNSRPTRWREHDVGGPEARRRAAQAARRAASSAPPGVGREQHDPGRGERHPDEVGRRREAAIATASGPTNSSVTAIPSGIRSSAR